MYLLHCQNLQILLQCFEVKFTFLTELTQLQLWISTKRNPWSNNSIRKRCFNFLFLIKYLNAFEFVLTLFICTPTLAHQFFGNLVTPDFWSEIWLSEGPATLFEFYTVHMTHPEYRTMDLFNIQKLQSVFKTDSLATTKPMNNPGNCNS